tara:strand:- start:58 stop:1314 length:1257 start_codon:yes stop_codon:yes gene_type:complete
MNKILTFRDGKLHIFQRQDKYKGKSKTSNWYGRTYIQGKDKVFSSGETNLPKAKKILFERYDDLRFQKKNNIQVHQHSFKDCLTEFLKSNDDSNAIRDRTKKWYIDRFKLMSGCKELLKLNVGTLTAKDIEKTFLVWRFNKAKDQKKVLRGRTVNGDLMAISGFLKWCYDHKLRKSKLENIGRLLNKQYRNQRTHRVGFTKDEYNHLLKISRKRIKEGRSLRVRFERERLHQFIVFMVGTGLRVEECLSLEWGDITFMDRMKVKLNQLKEPRMDDNERYWLSIEIRNTKTNERTCKSVSSSYFALQRLMKLYNETGLEKVEGEIFKVKSFREGLNSLLDEAQLKTKKIGSMIVSRDSKSFRNTFIQLMLDKGINSTAIAKNCGTSTVMIDKFYTANTAIESMLDVWLNTGRTKLKAVS